MLDRQSILNTYPTDDRTAIDMSAWGGTVYLRPLTLAALRQATTAAEAVGLDDATPMLLARCCEQEDGSRLFEDDDALAIAEMSLKVIKPLVAAVNEINGFNETAEALAGK